MSIPALGGHGPTFLQLVIGIALTTGLIVAALSDDLATRAEMERRLAHQAAHDLLTGLPNRLLLGARLTASLDHARATGRPLGVLFVDLDQFKVINDSLGHEHGDALLVEIARRLQLVSRPRDTVARFGGDEFVILCPDLDGEASAEAVARRVIDAVRAPVVHEGRTMVVGASVGVVVTDGVGLTAEAVMRDSDIAMYRAKHEGRNRFELFNAESRARAMERWELEVELRRAIDDDELELRYQPMVSVADGAVVAVEALLRWRSPTRGLLAPPQFLYVAEESGLIVDVGRWVLENAARDVAALGADVALSVNVSALQLHDSGALAALVRRSCASAGLSPTRLWLEVTESALLPGAALSELAALRGLGLHIAVDDFGTGYSSLGRLRGMPVDILKIDQAFVGDLGDEAVLASLVDLAHALGLVAIAEGVERPEQLGALRAAGCDLAQGYHLGRPVPAAQLPALLARDPLPGGRR